MAQTSGTPTTPSKTGWHLVDFANGDVGVVQWTGSRWNWTNGLNAPASPIVGVTYLSSTAAGLASSLPKLASSLPSNVWQTLLSSLDHGDLMNGKPILVDSSGATQTGGTASTAQGATSQAGSEADATSVVPGVSGPDLSAINSFFSAFTNVSTWIRLGEAVLGAVLIFIGLRSMVGGMPL